MTSLTCRESAPEYSFSVAAPGKNLVNFDGSDYRWLDSEREIRADEHMRIESLSAGIPLLFQVRA
jgi:hypothetical protein